MQWKWVCGLVFAVTVLWGFSTPLALAQEEPAILGEVVSTATRTEVPLEELGVSATVITGEEMDRRKATDVLQVLRDVAGINVVQTGDRGGNTSLFTRGGENNFTMVLIDGVQVNEAGGAFDFSTLTSDNVERIEVIRGPQSALYGSDAIGGAINIITKRGRGKPTVSISTANGAHSENGAYRGEQKISSSGGSELIGYSLAYGRIDDKGILDTNDDFYNNTFSGRVDLYPVDTCDITLTARLNDAQKGVPTENGGDLQDSVFPGLDPDQNWDKRELAVSLRGRFEVFPWWEHVAQLSIHSLDTNFDDPPNPAWTALDAPPGSETDSLQIRSAIDYHMNFRFPRDGAVRSIFTVGYEFEKESLDQRSLTTLRYGPIPVGVFSSFEDADARRFNHGFYLQDQITFLDRLHITGGFRVEDNDQYGTDVNPRASVAYEILETGTKVRGAVGTGIKEPTFLENFGGFSTVGNPDLKPEKSFSWELGVEQELWEDRIRLGFTYFWNDYTDLVAFVATPFPLPTPVPPNYDNIQAAKAWGMEFTASIQAGYGLTFGGDYTYLETEVTDDGGIGNLFFAQGQELLRRPNNSGAFFIDWLWGGLNVHLNGTYVGERDDILYTVTPGAFGFYDYMSERVVNDAYFVLDLAVSYTFVDLGWHPLKALKIFAVGRNVLDEDYQEVIGYSSPRFSAMGGIEFVF